MPRSRAFEARFWTAIPTRALIDYPFRGCRKGCNLNSARPPLEPDTRHLPFLQSGEDQSTNPTVSSGSRYPANGTLLMEGREVERMPLADGLQEGLEFGRRERRGPGAPPAPEEGPGDQPPAHPPERQRPGGATGVR